MAPVTLDLVEQAFQLIGTPLVLETLDDLAHDRSPYARPGDPNVITRAVDYLITIGAATKGVPVSETGTSPVEITSQGRELFWRLVTIEEKAQSIAPISGTA